MEALKGAIEKEKEKRKRGQEKGQVKAGKQKVTTTSTSSESLTTSPSEGEEPAEKIKAMKMGKIYAEGLGEGTIQNAIGQAQRQTPTGGTRARADATTSQCECDSGEASGVASADFNQRVEV